MNVVNIEGMLPAELELPILDMEITQDEKSTDLADDFLGPHIISLMFSEPFWAQILRGVRIVKDNAAVPTAGVACGPDGSVSMAWNSNFLKTLTDYQIKGLLKHEAMHIALAHITTRKFKPHAIHNIAADLAINCHIPDIEMPPGGLMPGKAVQMPKNADTLSAEELRRHMIMSDAIKALPKFESTEYYYTELMKNDDFVKAAKEHSEAGGMIGVCNGKCQPGQAKNGDGSGDITVCTCGCNGGSSFGFDSHNKWADGMSDDEKELVKNTIKNVVINAVKQADRNNRWGTVPAEMRQEIRSILQGTVDWRAVLRQFCGVSNRSDRTSSWTRLNKRFPGLITGTKRSYSASIAVYVDQSGSVSNEDLERVFAELNSLAKHIEFTLYHFDSEVDLESETVWKKRNTINCHRTRSGGTMFNPPSNHANKNHRRFDGYIIMTDGESHKPKPSKLKRCWVIIPNRDLIFEADNRDTVVKMSAKCPTEELNVKY
jgi:predicted metal-dependent peptidase